MMLNYATIASLVFLVPFGILSIFQGDSFIGIFDLSAFAIVAAAVIYYKKTLNYQLLTNVLILILGSLFLVLLYSNGVDYSGPLWSYIFPVSVMFMVGRKKGLLFSLGYFIIANIILMINVSRDIYTVNFHLRFLGSFAAITIVAYYVEYIRETIHGQLREKNMHLEESLARLAKQETIVAEKELHYRTLFEASKDAIFLMNGETFTDCNPTTLEMFGCKRDEIINQSPIRFSPPYQPDGRPSSEKAFEKINAALDNRPQFFEWVHCKLDGTEFFAEVNLNLIELNNQKQILASVRDISLRKKAIEDLKHAKEKAENSDRLKSDFLAQMSHEIRTPINTIMNYTSLLKMEFEDRVSEDNEGSFKSIQNAAIRLLRTIDLILNISDLEAGTYDPKFERKNLADDIIRVVNEFKQAAEIKNITLNFINKTNSVPYIYIDSYTLSQTIANLIDNAIKYTDSGKVEVIIYNNRHSYILEINDTGVGISEEYLPKLFDKFSQEDAGYTRRYEGSGLGLALVKKYCEINNISIDVKSKKTKGTKFILKIPIMKD